MDNWGDPWADDAASDPPAKREVKLPLPLPTASVVLNGFLDDAQWGNAEEADSAAGWEAVPPSSGQIVPPGLEKTSPKIEHIHTQEIVLIPATGASTYESVWDPHIGVQTSVDNPDKVVSEASDSGTTVQGEEASTPSPTHFTVATHRDDDDSTRPSTSPSDASHTEAHTESPRTSFEDERTSRKAAEPETISMKYSIISAGYNDDSKLATPDADDVQSSRSELEDEFGDFEENEVATDTSIQICKEATGETLEPSSPLVKSKQESENPLEFDLCNTRSSLNGSSSGNLFSPDLTLIDELFSIPESKHDGNETALDDPISTTSERKTWYRVTRKQTLREYNSGTDDDSYVRINWMNSQIRTKVSNIVGRWATEDRMSVRGQSAAGTFFWDVPASQPGFVEPYRKRPSLPISTQTHSSTQNPRPETFSGVPAQFNWSTSPVTSSTSQGPNSPISPGHPSIPTPLTVKITPVAQTSRERRRSSLDLTKRISTIQAHKRTATVPETLLETVVAESPSSNDHIGDLFVQANPPQTGTTTNYSPLDTQTAIAEATLEGSDPWGDLSHLETINQVTQMDERSEVTIASVLPTVSMDHSGSWGDLSHPATIPPVVRMGEEHESAVGTVSHAAEDDDDEWGEMVQSPSKSEVDGHEQSLSTFSNTLSNHTSTPAKSPQSARSSAFQTPTPKHASPIVRLQGTVSPTSASFRFNSFLPPVIKETGPIGRERLRKASNASPDQRVMESNINQGQISIRNGPIDAFSSFESSLPQQPSSSNELEMSSSAEPFSMDFFPTAASPSTNSVVAEAPTDTLFSADFSIFESAPAPASPSSQPQGDPSDPFSIFETAISVSPAPISRPVKEPKASLSNVPLTGVPNLAKRRKEEEEEIVQNIIAGLPDLSYMLQRG